MKSTPQKIGIRTILMLLLMILTTASAWADEEQILDGDFSISYIYAGGNEATCFNPTQITSTDYSFGDSNQDLWFYVNGEVTIDSELQFNSNEGFTNIILCDDAKLTVRTLTANNNLNIYCQANKTGEIIVNNSDNGVALYSGGAFIINGGTITVTSVEDYGIYAENSIILAGGTITASSYTTNGLIKVADDFFMSDGTKIYSGTLFDCNNADNCPFKTLNDLNDSIGGKELTDVTNIVVTQDNFYCYFDGNGNLLNDVPFDKLIFHGEFTELAAGYVHITKPIIITGDSAVLNNMGFEIASEYVTLDNMTLNSTTSLGDLISVGASNVDLTNLDITYDGGDEMAVAINVAGTKDDSITAVNIKNNTIFFESHVSDDSDFAIALKLTGSTGALVDGNRITAKLPCVYCNNYDEDYYIMGSDKVNAVRLKDCRNLVFTNNIINSTTNEYSAEFPTIQSIQIIGCHQLILDNNSISLIDEKTPAGKNNYIYGINFGYNGKVTFSNNNFKISTKGGKDAAGSAYAFQIVESDVNIIGDSITSISNGPNLGIYVASILGEDPALIEDNFIYVTGTASSTGSWALVSGIEIETGDVKIHNNTVYTYNVNEYDENAYMYGISYAQWMYGNRSFDIQNNTVYTEGRYAISVIDATRFNVVKNTLIAHELFGDDAVNPGECEDVNIEKNLPGKCGDTSINGGADVTWSYDTLTKELTISGTGPMMYYGSAEDNNHQWHSTAPWSHLDSEIQKVIVEDGVTYIGSYAFAYCTALTSISLPASVVALGHYVCYTSAVTRIDIPSTTVATIGTDGFGYCPADLQIAVPGNLLKTYQTATNWSDYAAKLVGVLSETIGFDTTFATGNYEYTRTFKCGVASTVCLPFSVTAAQATSVGQFYIFAGIDKSGENWEVIMEETTNKVSNDLTAHTPYLFMPYIFDGKSQGDEVELTFSGSVSSPEIAGSVIKQENENGSFWSFQGVFYNILWDETHNSGMLGKVYGFAANSYSPDDNSYTVNPGDFVKAGEGASIPSFRAFMQYTGSSAQGAPMRGGTRSVESLPNSLKVKLIDANGTITATGEIRTETGDFIIDTWHDMNGRILPDAPTAPGMYIHNGNQVLIKY